MSPRVLVVPALVCSLAILGAPASLSGSAHAVSSTAPRLVSAKAAPTRVDVPAYLGQHGLKGRLPVGGTVAYRLAKAGPTGQRVLGDWDGDGVPTPGIFTDGVWRLSSSLVRPGGPAATVAFGQVGDRPVVGDWNGDGVTDLGVVHGTQWSLALGPFAAQAGTTDPVTATVWKQLTFGVDGGTPVAGDWNGDGVDGIGSVDGRHWLLAPTVTRTADPASFSYGAPGDQPVVGDWDGDGSDGIAVDRGSTWYLSNRALRPHTDRTVVLARRGGDVPVAWRVPTARGTVVCPTRSPAVTLAAGSRVVPSPVLDRDFMRSVGHTGHLVRGSLIQTERFLLGARYDAEYARTRSRPYLGLLGGTGDELAIRLPAMAALTVAVGLRTGAYDATVIGRSPQFATAYVAQLVRSIACSHQGVSPGGWGRGWETAHWAMLAGAAAWLMWDRLSAQTRADVAAMVVTEANHQLWSRVPYWSLPDGTRVTPGDTKAEEDAWNAGLLALAAAMMPSAPRAQLWRAKAAELGVAAYSTKSDIGSTAVVNGVTLGDRLQGYNAYPDGTVENHQRIHPDYAASVQLLWLAADFDRLARQPVPQAMFHDGGLVYSALSGVSYTAGAGSPAGDGTGTFQAPGGTVYRPGSTSIYYPQGDDWGTARRAHFVSLDAHAMVYERYLGAASWPAADALLWHERGQRDLWASSGADDGRTYSADPSVAATQDTYPGREEYAASNLATAWLALYVGQLGLPRIDNGSLPVPDARRPAAQAPPASTHLAP